MSYRSTEFKNLDNEFTFAAQDILDSSESSIESLENLLDKYNSIVSYIDVDWDRKKKSTKEHIKNVLEADRITIQRCFEKLNLPLTLPGSLLSTIHYIPQPQKQTKSSKSRHSQTVDVLTSANKTQTDQIETESNSAQTEQIVALVNYTQTEIVSLANNSTQTTKSKMDAPTFLKLCGSQITKDYAGDPLTLKSFIKSIKLLKSVAGDNLDTLKLFVLTKITSKALECVREEPETVDQIIEDLEKFIKPENSKVIESQIQGLRFNPGKAKEFTDEAEKLAEALQRTLIIEGISQNKAREMAVERTVDLCRQSAKTEKVGTILASTSFASTKDVLAKFVVETSKEKTDKQILSFRQQNNNSYNRQNNFNGRQKNNFNNRFSQRGRGNGYRPRFFNNSNRNFNNNRPQQYNRRGRGGFRNNFNNYANNNNGNERYVRMVAENYHGPPQERRAEPQNAIANQPTILRLAQSSQ